MSYEGKFQTWAICGFRAPLILSPISERLENGCDAEGSDGSNRSIWAWKSKMYIMTSTNVGTFQMEPELLLGRR